MYSCQLKRSTWQFIILLVQHCCTWSPFTGWVFTACIHSTVVLIRLWSLTEHDVSATKLRSLLEGAAFFICKLKVKGKSQLYLLFCLREPIFEIFETVQSLYLPFNAVLIQITAVKEDRGMTFLQYSLGDKLGICMTLLAAILIDIILHSLVKCQRPIESTVIIEI